jgi:putative hemolysin
MAESWFELAIIVLLIILNGFFALSEMAIIASSKIRLKNMADDGNRRARIALGLAEQPDTFLSTVQIGISLIGIFTGAYGGATLADRLRTHFAANPVLEPYSGVLGIVLVVVPLTFASLLFGELLPKRLAVGNPERLASATAPFMRTMLRITQPVVYLLAAFTNVVIRSVGAHRAREPRITEEDIRGLIGEGARAGVLEDAERDMFERIFRLGDRQVGALMTHRTMIDWLDLEDDDEHNLQKMKDSPHSRFPVAQGGLENTLGVVKAKEVLKAWSDNKPLDLRAQIRRPLFVPETMRAMKLLDLFRSSGLHMALIVDEYGDLQGIVTLYDVLEAIVGDIRDIPVPGAEQEEPSAVRRDDGSWLLDAMLPLDEVGAILELRQPMADEDTMFQTLAGFVLKNLDRIPSMADSFEWGGYRFEVVDMDGRRIDRVMVSRLDPADKVNGQG